MSANPETYTPRALQHLLDESERALHQSETSRTTENATHEAQLATLEKTLASLQRRATRFETERRAKDNQIASLEEKLAKSETSLSKIASDFFRIRRLHKDNKSEVERLKKEVLGQQERLRACELSSRRHSDERNRWYQDRQQYDIKVSTLQDELRFVHQEETLLHQEFDRVQRLLVHLQEDHNYGPEAAEDTTAGEPSGNDLASEIQRSSTPDYEYTSESGLGRTPRALGVHLEERLIASPTKESEGSHEYNERSIEATSYTSSSDATILSPLIMTAVVPLSASDSNVGGRTPVSRQIELPAVIEKSANTSSEEPEEEYNDPASPLLLRSEGVVGQKGPSVSPSSGISETPEDVSCSTSSLAILLSDVEARPDEELNASPRSSFSETTQDSSTASSPTIRPHDVRRLVDEGVQTAPSHVISSHSMLEIQGILTYARHPDEAEPPSTRHELQLTADAIVHYHAPMQWPMKPDAVVEVEAAERWKALKQDLAVGCAVIDHIVSMSASSSRTNSWSRILRIVRIGIYFGGLIILCGVLWGISQHEYARTNVGGGAKYYNRQGLDRGNFALRYWPPT